jgi:hypothetical protein
LLWFSFPQLVAVFQLYKWVVDRPIMQQPIYTNSP